MADVLPTPSNEQAIIINKLNDGGNLCICAVAGAGKTTTLLLMSLAQSDKRILIITYSKSLQLETDAKVKQLNLNNVDVRTIHSAAGYAYNKPGKVRDDKVLLALKDTPLPRHSDIHQYDIIMIDECQDIIDATRDFIYKIIQNKQVVIVGDARQCIYEFKGASPEYLKHPDEYFDNGLPWDTLYLTETYRFGPNIARFVNGHIRGSADDIPMIGKGSTEGYVNIICNERKLLIKTIIGRITQYGINNVAIISNTVKEVNKMIRSIATEIEELAGYSPVFVDNTSEKSTDSIEDRLYFGTIHSMKGLERDVIFVLIDESYFKFVCTEWYDPIYVPNIFYVAMTRAKHELFWYVSSCSIQESEITGLRSINPNTIYEDVPNINGVLDIGGKMHPIDQYNRTYYRGVCDMIEYRTVVDMVDMLSYLTTTSKTINKLTNKYKDNVFYIQFGDDQKLKESVSYLYGIAIPTYVEYKITGNYEGIDNLLRNLIITTYYQENKTRLNLTNIEELKQRIIKNDRSLINNLGPHRDRLLLVIKKSDPLTTQDLLSILSRIINNHKSFIEISNIINNPNKSPYDIMKLVCLSEILTRPYMRNKLGDLSWINEEFLNDRCAILHDYVINKHGKIKFETSIDVTGLHPVLKHLGEPKENGDMIDVSFKDHPNIIDWFNDSISQDIITTRNGAAVSFAEIKITGRIDCHINSIPYEFKLSHELHDSHLIQLATYMAIQKKPVGYLFNYFTGIETKVEMNDDMYDRFLSVLFRKVYNWSDIDSFERVNDIIEDEDEGVLYTSECINKLDETPKKPKCRIVKRTK